MNTTTCPEKNRLRDYLHGRLDEIDSDAVEEHLASCGLCEAISTRLDQDGDWLTHYLRASTDEQLARESAPGWIGEVRRSMFEGPVENANHEGRFPVAAADGLVLGAYEIHEVIGRGGMGVVCRAVAVKVISTSTAADAAERFEREMRAVGGLHHPAIVQATDAGTASGRAYLAMELIDGVDLRRLLELAAPLSVADACEIVREAAVGLSVAHAAGIVHRDIKPSNVMLSRDGQVKLLDFGLALSEEAIEATCQTSVGRLLGTLDYLAPEQTDGSAVDARADIYALGATLFTLLAGCPPMGRSTEVPILQHLRRLAL